MPPILHPNFLYLGIALLLLGIWAWRFSSRHSIDLKGAAISSGMTAAWKRERPTVPGEIQDKLNRITGEKTNVGKARAAGGTVIRAFIAKIAFLISLIAIPAGLAGIAAAFLWK